MADKLSLDGNDMTDLPMPKRMCEKLSTLVLKRNGFTNIKALNISLRNLKKLKHLKFSWCSNLDYIPSGLLSCLPMLQFLDIYGGRYTFKSENFTGEKDGDGSSYIADDNQNEECNNRGDQEFMRIQVVLRKANLVELKVLKERQQLKRLGLNLEMETILDLQKYVDVGCIWKLKLIALQDSKPEDVIEALLMVGPSIEVLKLRNFRRLKDLILTKEHVMGEIGLNDCFSRLYSLQLVNLSGLIKITWKKLMLLEMFPSLTHIKIKSCHDLQNLTWTGHLPGLRYLYVDKCSGLKEIINVDENDEYLPPLASSIFPQLQKLVLQDLIGLQTFSDATLDSPKLNFLDVKGCPGLKRVSFSFQPQQQQQQQQSLIPLGGVGYMDHTTPFRSISFQPQIAEKIKFNIRCEKTWWEGLEWEDGNIKSYLQPFVDLWEPESEEAYSSIFDCVIRMLNCLKYLVHKKVNLFLLPSQ